MKIKLDFVTNSSSSSFIVKMSEITPLQIEQIKNYAHVAAEMCNLSKEEKYSLYNNGDWTIIEEDGYLKGVSSMDNFEMEKFMEKIGVNIIKAKFDECF